ncbi:MAG: hypothetical protein Tsb0020_48480 [Haliangiales bacterium]
MRDWHSSAGEEITVWAPVPSSSDVMMHLRPTGFSSQAIPSTASAVRQTSASIELRVEATRARPAGRAWEWTVSWAMRFAPEGG